jgi:acetyl-CoA synthetase
VRGNLAIKQPWPGQMRTVYGDHKRFEETYFAMYPGYYFTGDGCRRDEDGYYWITGRVDDVINVSGHRMGTAEVESPWSAHDKVAEAAVVGYPARDQGPGHLRLRHADGRRGVHRRAARRSWSSTCARRSARSPRRT